MELLFKRFDLDNSDTLELNELLVMFEENGIFINPEIIKKLFKLADKKKTGMLTLEQFKQLMSNKGAMDSKM